MLQIQNFTGEGSSSPIRLRALSLGAGVRSTTMAFRAIERDCWFSVGPGMVRGKKGRELVSRMPRGRVLTETDGPFAQIDARSVWPWEAGNVIADLSKIWDLSPSDVEQQLCKNMKTLGDLAQVQR